MRIKMIVLALVIAIASSVFGQDSERKKRFAEFKEKLELTDDQVEQFKYLYKQNAESKKESGLEEVSRDRKKLAELDAKIREILTPAQYEKYLDILITRNVDKQMTVIEIKVGLDQQQVKDIRAIVFDGTRELRVIRNSSDNKEDKIQKVKEVYHQMDKQILILLDEKQKEKYDIYKEERRKRFRSRAKPDPTE